MLSSMELLKKPFTSGCDGCGAKWPPVKHWKTMVTWPPSYPVCALILVSVHSQVIFVH